MIIDCRTWHKLTPRQVETVRRRVFVNGLEVLQVWYLDTDAGYVKTYDVFGDGKAHSTQSVKPISADGFEAIEDAGGIWSRTLWGRIELRPLWYGTSTV